MYTASGNLARRIASRLLANDAIFRAVQRGLRSSMEARRSVDRNVGRLLAGLNIPSNQEVERILEEVRALDRSLEQLQAQLRTLSDAADRPPPNCENSPPLPALKGQ